MSFTSVAAGGLKRAVAVMGEEFLLRGATYSGVIDDITTGEAFAAGMSIPTEPISVTFKTRTFSPALVLGERITARDSTYVTRSISTDEISITLHCEKLAAR